MDLDIDLEESNNEGGKELSLRAAMNFKILRPICVEIMKNPNLINLSQLCAVLRDDEVDLESSALLDYVIFPLNVHLKVSDKYKQDLRISLHNCLEIILVKWEIKSFVLFLELFQRFNISLGLPKKPMTLNTELPEDVLDPIVSSLLALVQRSLHLHPILYTEKYIPAVGHSIFMLFQVVRDDTVKSLRIKAMKALELLVTSCSGNKEASHQVYKFLPGLASNLRNVCSVKSGRHQQAVVLEALKLFKACVETCISFESKDTLQLADLNLSTAFSGISEDFVLHEKTAIREGLLRFSVDLMNPLSGKLPLCSEVLWNNLLILCNDSEPEISSQCSAVLLNSKNKSQFCNFKSTLSLTQKAIIQIKNGNDTESILTLKRVVSSLTVIKLHSSELHIFLTPLFELISTSLVRQIHLNNDSGLDTDHRTDNAMRQICGRLCQTLATKAVDMDDILEEIGEWLTKVTLVSDVDGILTYKISAVLFCVNAILSLYLSTSSATSSPCRNLEVNELIELAQKYLFVIYIKTPLKVEKSTVLNSTENPKFILARMVYTAYAVEGMGILCRISPPYVLPLVLYTLVEQAGLKDLPIVSETAIITLGKVATAGEMELSTFLAKNLDLIMSELSIRIMYIANHPHCPNAIIYLADYFDFSQSQFVGLVEQVFFQTSDIWHEGKNQDLYGKVFYAFLASMWIHKCNVSYSKGENEKSMYTGNEICNPKTELTLYDLLTQYQKSVGADSIDVTADSVAAESQGDEEDDNEDGALSKQNYTLDPEANDEYENDAPLSIEFSFALKICRRVLSYLPTKERIVQLLAMDCLIIGVQLLAPYENTLLPLAHTIWSNLVPRFGDKDYVVVRKAFELLLAMATTSGNFLKKRTLEEVFPKLALLLKTLGEESRKVKNKNRVYYTYTQAYKLQLTMLQGMAQLCYAIEIQERDLDTVATGCLTYLTLDQHKNLREASTKLISALAHGKFGSTIWMKLVAYGLCDFPSVVIHSSFKPIPSNFSFVLRK